MLPSSFCSCGGFVPPTCAASVILQRGTPSSIPLKGALKGVMGVIAWVLPVPQVALAALPAGVTQGAPEASPRKQLGRVKVGEVQA